MGASPIRELRMRVATWNTKFGRADESLVADRGLDLLCLQEARRETVDRFATHFDWAFFAHDPDLAAIRQERPDGPLAVSYRTGKVKGRHGNPCRYDHIFATRPDFRVERVEHLYDEGCEAGSDHSLVIADLDCDVEGHPDRSERPVPTSGD